jgi:hypothetical protein
MIAQERRPGLASRSREVNVSDILLDGPFTYTKCLAMPTEQGLWLHNAQSLPPCSNRFCWKHQEKAIRCGTCQAFDLSAQHNELLAQEGVLGNQFRFSSRKIRDRPEQQ